MGGLSPITNLQSQKPRFEGTVPLRCGKKWAVVGYSCNSENQKSTIPVTAPWMCTSHAVRGIAPVSAPFRAPRRPVNDRLTLTGLNDTVTLATATRQFKLAGSKHHLVGHRHQSAGRQLPVMFGGLRLHTRYRPSNPGVSSKNADSRIALPRHEPGCGAEWVNSSALCERPHASQFRWRR